MNFVWFLIIQEGVKLIIEEFPSLCILDMNELNFEDSDGYNIYEVW